MENENSNVEKTKALNIADVTSSAYIKNFGDVKRFEITVNKTMGKRTI